MAAGVEQQLGKAVDEVSLAFSVPKLSESV